MTNNIKQLLEINKMSINELSKRIKATYKSTHDLVNRDNLATTPLGTLLNVASALDVDVRLLYADSKDELEVIKLFNQKYCGGLSVLTLRQYKKEIEGKVRSKINRNVIVSYKYNSKIDMSGVEDELELRFTIGDVGKGKYVFLFKGKSVHLTLEDRIIDSIINCIDEYETGRYDDIFSLYNELDNENMYPNLMELIEIKIKNKKETI